MAWSDIVAQRQKKKQTTGTGLSEWDKIAISRGADATEIESKYAENRTQMQVDKFNRNYTASQERVNKILPVYQDIQKQAVNKVLAPIQREAARYNTAATSDYDNIVKRRDYLLSTEPIAPRKTETITNATQLSDYQQRLATYNEAKKKHDAEIAELNTLAEQKQSGYFSAPLGSSDFTATAEKGKTNNANPAKGGTLSQATEQEKNLMNYWYGVSTDKGNEYREYLAKVVNSRLSANISEKLEGETNPVKKAWYKTGLALAGGLEQFSTGTNSALTGGTQTGMFTEANQRMIANETSALGKLGLQLVTTLSNMAPAIAVSTLTGNPLIGSATLGVSAGGNAYAQAINEGKSPREAAAYGLLIGASEGALQYALGGIGKLGSGLATKIDDALKVIVKKPAILTGLNAVANMGQEALEEGLQEILEPVFRLYALDETTSVNWEQVLESALLGALSAGLLNAPSAISNTLSNINPQAPTQTATPTPEITPQITETPQITAQNKPIQTTAVTPTTTTPTATTPQATQTVKAVATPTADTTQTPQTAVQAPTINADAQTAETGIDTTKTQNAVVEPVNATESVQTKTDTDTFGKSVGAATKQAKPTVTENKVGDNQQTWATTRVGTDEEAQSLTQIVKQAMGDLGISITRGNIDGSRKVIGQYGINAQTVRVRTNNDILTVAHEIGHHLDNLFNLQAKASPEATAELESNLSPMMLAAYKANKLTGEGIAEFVRYYLSNTTEAKTAYPEFSKLFESEVSPEMLKVVNRLAKSMNTYLSASTIEQYRKAISMSDNKNKTPFSEKIQDIKERFVEKMIDDLRGLKNFGDATNNNYSYILAQNSRYASGAVDTALKTELRDMNGKYIGESLVKAVEDINVKNTEERNDFNLYLALRHAPERINLGQTVFANPDLQSPAKITATLTALEAKYPKFKDASERVYTYQKNLLQSYGVESGMISAELAKEWDKKYPHYVPFQRDLSNTQKKSSKKASTDISKNPTPFKKAFGSGLDIVEPLEGIVYNTNKMILAAKSNAVRRATTQTAATTEGAGKFLEKISTPLQAKKFDATTLKAETIEALKDGTGLSENTLEDIINGVIEDTLVQYGRASNVSKNTMLVLNNGELEYWQVNDTSLLHALENVSVNTVKGFWDAYGTITRVITQAATGGNVIWSVFSNALRDIQTGAVYDRSGNVGKFGLNIAKAYFTQATDKAARKKGVTSSAIREYYREYLALGGANNISRISADRADTAKSFKGILSKKENLNPYITVSNISDTIEQAPRIAEYASLRDKGYTPQEAFYQAMEVTVNFRRGGEWSRQINKAVPFFNASVQGIDRAIRNYTASDVAPSVRKQTAVRRLSKFIAVSAIVAFAQTIPRMFDDDEREAYAQLSAYNKNNSYNIYLGNGKFFSIKKPRELGILTSLFERSMEYTLLSNKDAFYEFGEYTAEQMLPPVLDILPLWVSGDIEAMGGSLASSLGAVGSIFSLTLNVDYRGNPIVSQGLSSLEPRFQYDQTTSLLARTIGDITNLSPKKIDYALGTWFGMYQTINKSLLPVDGAERDLTLGVANTYVKDNQYSTDITNVFYTGKTDIAQKKASYPNKSDYMIANTDYSKMAEFYSNTVSIAQNTDMTTVTNRAARQTVLEMLEQFSDDMETGKTTRIKEQLNDFAAEVSDTTFFPQTMNTTFKYTTDKDVKIEIALTYTQYLNYQTKYNAFYYDEIASVIDESYTKTDDKMSAIQKAKRIAKEKTDEYMYKTLTGR